MKKNLWRFILLVVLLGLGFWGLKIGYQSYRMQQAGYPVNFFRAKNKVPVHKPRGKTFRPQKIVVQPPRLTQQTRQFKRLLSPIVGKNRFVGTLLIVKNGKPVYNQGYGYANYQQKALNTANSEYQILSMQKSMTAMLIMQQVQAGNLRLTDHLAEFYPAITGASQITIRSMLNMQTGLRIKQLSKQVLSSQGVTDYAARHVQFVAAKNNQWSYQPINYTLLAGILQKITGQTYYHIFTHHIITPLKLHNTGFVMQADRALRLSTPYLNQPITDNSINYLHAYHELAASQHNELATGNVYMSTGDFYKVTQAILQARFLTAQNTAILHEASGICQYGGGLYSKSPTSYWSHGVGYGEESGVMISRDGQNAVVMLSNYHLKKSALKKQCAQIYQNLMQGMY